MGSSLAADLSDDASKGIIIAAASYGFFSLIFPQELVIMFYLIANITIGAYMMKVTGTLNIRKLFVDGTTNGSH